MGRRAWKSFLIIAVGLLMLCGAGVVGQTQQKLDGNCTVSVLNRTVRVNPDGSWVLPNIPANFGQVKARATCVKNGVTSFGESDFFTLPANGAVNLPDIVLGSATQIPSSLSINPATLSLNASGQTVQLSVTATYPDSSTKNVSAASTGTNYTTSNAGIAAVSANGLVTAVTSGTVVIQATNDGASGIINASVVLSNTDSDGDGIPDDVETSLGLDPHNPVDAQEDFDRDGLTNLREFQLGTNIRNRDTDADGLSDGAEVDTHHTNPLIADTDGDRIPDGVEVQTSTNPLDPNSYDLRAATANSILSPPSFILTTSILFPITSQQLSWKVNLIDGKTTLDLTTDPRTNYVSSDPTVCNFGAQKGLVFAGNPGSCIISISNNNLSVAVSGTVQSFTPMPLSFVDIPGFANNVDVNGNYAFVAAGSSGLQVVDVSNRVSPHIVATRSLPGNANDVVVTGNFAYVAAGSAGLQIVDISNPQSPTTAGSLNIGGDAWDVVVKGNRAYVANGSGGLVIIDVSAPASPQRLGSLGISGISKGVDVDTTRQIAAVAMGTNGLAVVNVANPATLTLISMLPGGDVRDVAISGNFVFLADLSRSFTSVDLTNPAAPVLRASVAQNLGGLLQDVVVNGSVAAGADVFFVNGIPMIDVSSPASPQPRIILDFRNFRDDNGTGIALDQSYVYLTAEAGSISENGVNGTTRLYIGQYRNIQDNFGIPPTVQITSPTPGAQIIRGSSVTVTASAIDDVAVGSVSFFVNGQLAFTSATAPYQYTFAAPGSGSTLTLGAQAVDFGGNVGTASDVTINLVPDPGTTVVGTVVDVNQNGVAGATVSVTGGLSGTTQSNGSFTIPGVSTILGNLVVSATATVNGVLLKGDSAPLQPVRGGTTNAGNIVVAPFVKAIVVNRRSLSVHILNIANLSIESTLNLGTDVIDTAVTPDRSTAVVTSFGALRATFIDLAANPPVVTGFINTPMAAEDVAIACFPNCYAVVADGGSATTIIAIDVAHKTISSTLSLPVSAEGITVTPTGLVLVNSFGGNTIRVASLSSAGILSDTGVSVPSGGNGPLNVTVSPNGRTALVANIDGSVGVLQIATNGTVSLVGTIPSVTNAQSIAFTPDGLHAYVAGSAGVAVLNIDASNNVTDSGIRFSIPVTNPFGYFGVDQIVVTGGNKVLAHFPGIVVVIDAVTNTVIGTITIPNDAEAGGIAVIP